MKQVSAPVLWSSVLAPLALGVITLSGCANHLAPLERSPALPAVPTLHTEALKTLPPPQERIVAAVYRFRDQTGQFKPSDQVSSFSTAVTQGSTSILIRALEDSGWFVPIEREGLSNLLNERQIIQSIRAQYEGPEGQQLGPLPPLLYAGVILEGGIIGYDTNLLTGGVGLRYFGAGGSGQFRQDQVTVYLRAVSTQTGRVLKTVYTTKTILSQRLDGGIFRFVDFDRLLEAEIGYSFNEPPVLAVTEAIEEAVRSLVLEGVRENLWALRDPADRNHAAFEEHDRIRSGAAKQDAFGMIVTQDRSGFSFGLGAGARRYQGNFRKPLERPAAEIALRNMASPRWGLGLVGSVGQIGAQNAFETTAASVEAQGIYFLLPRARTSPFLRLGIGVMSPDVSDFGTEFGEDLFSFLSLGGGIERFVTPSLGLSVGLQNHYALHDGIDGIKEGSGRDSVWNLTVGLSFYRSGER